MGRGGGGEGDTIKKNKKNKRRRRERVSGLLLNPRQPGGMKQIKVLLLHRSWYNIHYSIQSTHTEIYTHIFCFQDNLGLCLVTPLKLNSKPFVQQNCTEFQFHLFSSISTTKRSISCTANKQQTNWQVMVTVQYYVYYLLLYSAIHNQTHCALVTCDSAWETIALY